MQGHKIGDHKSVLRNFDLLMSNLKGMRLIASVSRDARQRIVKPECFELDYESV